jgi:UDP-N-acetylglucosamine acyltransferase
LNLVGLRRNGVSRDAVTALKQAYRLLYRSALPRKEALARMEELGTAEVLEMVEFIRASQRGICPDHLRAAGRGGAAGSTVSPD